MNLNVECPCCGTMVRNDQDLFDHVSHYHMRLMPDFEVVCFCGKTYHIWTNYGSESLYEHLEYCGGIAKHFLAASLGVE